MKNFKATILSLTLLTALFAGAAGLCAQNQPSVYGSANAETGTTATPTTSQLISPATYQQYLPLNTPTDVAVTDDYTAIADGNVIRIYEGDMSKAETGAYRSYTHPTPVNQVAFDRENNLYFLSEYELFYLPYDSLNASAPTAAKMNIVCSGFTVEGDALYYYAMSKTVIKRYSLSQSTYDDINLPIPLQENSPLTFGKERLYCVCKNGDAYTINAVDPQSKSVVPIAAFSQPLQSIAVANNLFCAVTNEGHFYTYNYSNLPTVGNEDTVTPVTNTALDKTDPNGYVSAYTHGNAVYTVRGNAIRRYLVSSAAFDDFEITSASASANRLNGANDLFLSENRLFISDDGNDRISVYNVEKGTFDVAVPTTLDTSFLTSYKDTLFVSSAQEATLYSLSEKTYAQPLLTLSDSDIDGNVIGVACVYGRYYLLTDDSYCYTLTQSEGQWSYTETQNKTQIGLGLSATSFTSDVYGSLYVAYNSGSLYRFTEQELTTSDATGTRILDGLNLVNKIAVDYDGNIYALTQGVLTRYTQQTQDGETTYQPQPYGLSYDLVLDKSPTLLSFTFGVETTDAYLLYANNYVIKTSDLDIPKVNPIKVGNAVECIFGATAPNFSVVTVGENSILTEFDVNALKTATDDSDFPYIAFERRYAPFTALKIGEVDNYSILSVANETTGYRTYLVESSNCTAVPNFYVPSTETDKTGYVTNDVALYKFPYLNELLTVESVARGTRVRLLGEVVGLNRDYYEIAYQTENGATVTGFLPKAYVNAFNGADPLLQTESFGNTEDDTDAIGRLAYILLGLGAIAILVDFLLLRKPKDTEES